MFTPAAGKVRINDSSEPWVDYTIQEFETTIQEKFQEKLGLGCFTF